MEFQILKTQNYGREELARTQIIWSRSKEMQDIFEIRKKNDID